MINLESDFEVNLVSHEEVSAKYYYVIKTDNIRRINAWTGEIQRHIMRKKVEKSETLS